MLIFYGGQSRFLKLAVFNQLETQFSAQTQLFQALLRPQSDQFEIETPSKETNDSEIPHSSPPRPPLL